MAQVCSTHCISINKKDFKLTASIYSVDELSDDSDGNEGYSGHKTKMDTPIGSTPIQNSKYDMDTIKKQFNTSILNKDTLNAMAIIDEYTFIDFENHIINDGNTCLHYAVMYSNARFLYFLLQKGFEVCHIVYVHECLFYFISSNVSLTTYFYSLFVQCT